MLPQRRFILLLWRSPSRPTPQSTNAPNDVMFVTRPLSCVPRCRSWSEVTWRLKRGFSKSRTNKYLVRDALDFEWTFSSLTPSKTRWKFQDLPKLIILWVCLCTKIVLLVCVVHFQATVATEMWDNSCKRVMIPWIHRRNLHLLWNVIKWKVADFYCFLKSRQL